VAARSCKYTFKSAPHRAGTKLTALPRHPPLAQGQPLSFTLALLLTSPVPTSCSVLLIVRP
jgi:hypothetical protein